MFATNKIANEARICPDTLNEAYHVLNYNQQLVQFADSKAANLILINSLFIAAAQALGSATGFHKLLQAGYILFAAAAVLLCLNVIMTRAGGGVINSLGLDDCLPKSRPNTPDFVFFADMLERKSGPAYSSEFVNAPVSRHIEGVLQRAYVVAGIAQRKFRTYGPAQMLTALAAAVWVLANLIALF